MSLPRLNAPIVLVHGLLGFDRLQFCGLTLASYFAPLPDLLTAAGNRVRVATVSPTGSIAERAAQLRRFLDAEFPGERVHLVGHSMGGLDCRYLVSRLDMAGRVHTLTTVGTPHRGSAFADWGVRCFSRVARPFLDLVGMPYQAFFDLTTDACRRFNEETPNAPGVRYFSIAGRYESSWRTPEWELPHRIVRQAEGPNDGIVSVASATFGEACDVWEGDHVGLVNWQGPVAQLRGRRCDHAARYAEHLRRLAAAEAGR